MFYNEISTLVNKNLLNNVNNTVGRMLWYIIILSGSFGFKNAVWKLLWRCLTEFVMMSANTTKVKNLGELFSMKKDSSPQPNQPNPVESLNKGEGNLPSRGLVLALVVGQQWSKSQHTTQTNKQTVNF